MFKKRRLYNDLFNQVIDSFMDFRKFFNKLNTEEPFILKVNDCHIVPELNQKGKLMGLFVFDNSKEQQRFFYEFAYKISLGVEILPSMFECFYVGFSGELSKREILLGSGHEVKLKEFFETLPVARRYSKMYPNRIVNNKEAKLIDSILIIMTETFKNLSKKIKLEFSSNFNDVDKFEFVMLDITKNDVVTKLIDANSINYDVNFTHANEAILEDIVSDNTDKRALFIVNTFDVAVKDNDDPEAYYTHSVFYIIEGEAGIDVEFLSNKPESFSDVITSLFVDYINKHGIPKELVVNSFLIQEIIGDMASVLGIKVTLQLINSISDSYFLNLNETAKHFSSQIIDFPKIQYIDKQYYRVVFDALKEMAKISQLIFSNMKDKPLTADDVKTLIEDINDDIPGSNIKIETKEVSNEEYKNLKKKDMILNAFDFSSDEDYSENEENSENDEFQSLFNEDDDDFFNPDNNDDNNKNIVS